MSEFNIDAHTRLYCVLGNPVSHSLSPLMHNRAFRETGYNGAYAAFCVTDLKSAVEGIRALGIGGASVTIPHKIEVMDYLDEIDPIAVKIGAVNTIVNRDGRLCGCNTDCTGAMNALREKTDIAGKRVVIAGAGGAARAIGFGIVAEGGHLTIVNAFKEEGETLARDLQCDYRMIDQFGSEPCDILINATPVGMSPDVDDMVVKADDLHAGMVVMDIVYNPIQTRLLREAASKGAAVIDGVAMFVGQGAAQFELWTGLKAPVELMDSIVKHKLEEQK